MHNMFYFLYVIVRRVFEIVKEIEEIINILHLISKFDSTFSYRIELKLITKPGFLRLYSAGTFFNTKLTHLCSGE